MKEVIKKKKMTWGTDHPGHIVFLVDLSGSMKDKIDYVIDALYRTFQAIIIHCTPGGHVKNRVSVAVYGYNYHIVELLNVDAFGLAKAFLVAKKENKPIFDKNVEAKPEHQTCMKMAFDKAKEDIEQWIAAQRANGITAIPAPIVINITDGKPDEGASVSQGTHESQNRGWKCVRFQCTLRPRNIRSDTPFPDIRTHNRRQHGIPLQRQLSHVE